MYNYCQIRTAATVASVVVVYTSFMYIFYTIPTHVVPTPGSKLRCRNNMNKTLKKLATPRTHPWFFNATIRSRDNLYVWPEKVNTHNHRLGNRLFNYASTLGIAWRNRRVPILPHTGKTNPQYDLVKIFNIRMTLDEGNQIIQNIKTEAIKVEESSAGLYDNRFEQLPKRNVSLRKYLQSYKYFRDVEDQLRVDLTFKSNVLDAARRWLEEQTPEKWRRKKFVRVVIHVRRTDYTHPEYDREGWALPTNDYFRRAVSYFTDCLERVQFVILSDDLAWCQKHLNATDIVYSTGHSPAVDMAIASLCDHAIITIGSYGWWAAWFANGITITQQNLPRKGSTLAKRLRREDYYKPDWIGL